MVIGRRAKYDKKYYEKNSREIKEAAKERTRKRRMNPTYIEMEKQYRIKNIDKWRAYNNLWKKEKYHANIDVERAKARDRYSREIKKPGVKVNYAVSVFMRSGIRTGHKNIKIEKYTGYTMQELRKHLESKFADGMNWLNYGKHGWHIDHVIPKSLFEYTKPTDREFRQCWCLANLQPLWAKDNLMKHNKCNWSKEK